MSGWSKEQHCKCCISQNIHGSNPCIYDKKRLLLCDGRFYFALPAHSIFLKGILCNERSLQAAQNGLLHNEHFYGDCSQPVPRSLFALMLGTGRTLYSKTGKNIGRVLLLGAVGATLCYLIAAISNVPVIGLIACAFSGFCVSMLWPGNLIVASDRFPAGGIFIYAMMAAGGDLGGAVGPQLVGVITDTAIQNSSAIALAQALGLSPEQFGMKLGMLVGMLFPLFAIPLYAHIRKTRKTDLKR